MCQAIFHRAEATLRGPYHPCMNYSTHWQPLVVAVFSILLWILPIVVGSLVGNRKGRLALGLVLAILLGWIGVIIIAVVPPSRAERLRRGREI